MRYDYDALYAQEKDALGAPSKQVVSFFKGLPAEGRSVLDVGCGQGRDAVFIAELGFNVLGVDSSPHGIADLNEASNRLQLPMRGVVGDITSYKPEQSFDVLLFDRVLHMLDETDRLTVLRTYLGHLNPSGFCVIIDERPNLAAMKEVLFQRAPNWDVQFERAGNIIAQLP